LFRPWIGWPEAETHAACRQPVGRCRPQSPVALTRLGLIAMLTTRLIYRSTGAQFDESQSARQKSPP
jgi:hypothetical protein